MTPPVVVKLGGDALATPGRIAAQARRLAQWRGEGPLVVVASARRGVTDHLIALVAEVRSALGAAGAGGPASVAEEEAERALASGEVVSAALLALALNELGVKAVSLDAREAGVLAEGPAGAAWIDRIHAEPTEQLLAAGVIPVITGFQGWKRGRVATLGRGGSDISAVAFGAVLGASAVRFVKDAPGLRTADPKVVPDTVAIREAPHSFLAALTRAGSKVLHADAAELAERHRLPLEFWSLDGDRAETRVHGEARTAVPIRAATFQPGRAHPVTVSVLGVALTDLDHHRSALNTALAATGLGGVTFEAWPHGVRLQAPAPLADEALNILHRVVVQGAARCSEAELRAS